MTPMRILALESKSTHRSEVAFHDVASRFDTPDEICFAWKYLIENDWIVDFLYRSKSEGATTIERSSGATWPGIVGRWSSKRSSQRSSNASSADSSARTSSRKSSTSSSLPENRRQRITSGATRIHRQENQAMITKPGEYHDANSAVPVPQSRRVLDLIARGRLMPPLPIQVALRQSMTAQVVVLPALLPATDAEAA